MDAFGRLADHLVTELPITRLRSVLDTEPGPTERNGLVCGGGCGGAPDGTGVLCGIRCRPRIGAPGVIDLEGRTGLTADDVTDIRADFPKLRKAVLDRLEIHLNQLR